MYEKEINFGKLLLNNRKQFWHNWQQWPWPFILQRLQNKLYNLY